MIDISRLPVKAKKIDESVKVLTENYFTNIEFSGAAVLYDDIESNLFNFKINFSFFDLYNLLFKADLSGEVITLEIYDSLAEIEASQNNLKTFLKG